MIAGFKHRKLAEVPIHDQWVALALPERECFEPKLRQVAFPVDVKSDDLNGKDHLLEVVLLTPADPVLESPQKESVLKNVLDDAEKSYGEADDLPKLYRQVSELLNLAPSQHTETIFKQVLGGCAAVVGGLGAVRNKVGDAHGTGRRPVKPAPRHAELVVNLAGAMALFIIQTATDRRAAEGTNGGG